MQDKRRLDPVLIGAAALLLLALAVRVYRLDAQSLWYDEAVTAQVAGQGLRELTRWTADDIQPPLYYYAVAGWTRLVGRSEWALRFPSTFFGVLTVALLWAAARRLFGRGLLGRRAGGSAALLAAFSPLYVYYAQEARMYTMLTFLGALAGYALLRAAAARRAHLWWAVFLLASAALLYTHYFGVFLLLAYGVCWLLWCSRPACPARGRSLRTFAASALGIFLLYLPWLPAMLNRYRVDASYWQGALKLDEALRHVALSFTVAAPEMMLEGDALRLLPWFGLAFVLAAGALVWHGRRHQRLHVPVYLFVTLCVPLLCILLLASRTPKFNPRYLMLASPACLLLLAGGIAALPGRLAAGHVPLAVKPQHWLSAARVGLALLWAIFLGGASWASLHNWFTDPAFTKAQWREAAAYIRQARAADEAVVLVSGHAYPAWNYYAPDLSASRLPALDILDVNAVLDFGAGPLLAQALAGKSGAWLVSWQDEVVDPVGIAPYFLDRSGQEQPLTRSFWHVGVRHWRLASGASFPAEPAPQHTDSANFDHKLALLGWDDPVAGEITVYWRALNTLVADYQVSLIVEDAAGRALGRWDGRPASYNYPALRWRPGQAVFGRYPLPGLRDAPPGGYFVSLAVYSASDPAGLDIRDIADNPAGKRTRLGPIAIR